MSDEDNEIQLHIRLGPEHRRVLDHMKAYGATQVAAIRACIEHMGRHLSLLPPLNRPAPLQTEPEDEE